MLLWMLVLSAFPSYSQTVGENMIEDFESTHVTQWTSDVAGTLSQPITNSYSGSGNSSAHIASYTRNASQQYDYVVATLTGNINNIAAYVAGTKKFSMKVYTSAPIGTSIDFSIENTTRAAQGWPNGRHSNFTAYTTAQNAWTTLIFDYTGSADVNASQYASTLNQLTLAFKNNSFTSDTYYFDDIKGFSVTTPSVPAVPSTEHLWDNFRNVRRVRYSPVDGTLSTGQTTPSTTGNSSATVGKYIRSNNQYDVMAMNFDSTLLDLAAYKANTKKFSIKVYSPAIGTRIGFTLQDSAASLSGYPTGRYAEFSGTTTTANAWEKVVLSYTGTPDGSVTDARVDQLAVLVNANSYANTVLYMDSLFGPKFAAPPVAVVLGEYPIQSFDGGNKLSFGYRNGTLTQPVTNTDLTSGNASAHYASYVRNAGATYDVIVCDMAGISTDIANYFNNTKKVTMKVWTDAPVGSRIEFTLQNATRATANYPTGRHSVYYAVTSVTNAWETLTFTYFYQPDGSVDITTLDQMIISFRPGTNTSNTFRFDDIKGFPIIEYNDPTPHYEHIWDNFKNKRNIRFKTNSRLSIVSNPNFTGNDATLVGRYNRSSATNDTLRIRLDSAVNNLDQYKLNQKKFSLRVYSPAPGTSIQINLLDSVGAQLGYPNGYFAEFSANTTTTNEWETVVLTFRYSPDNTVPASSVNAAQILVNLGTAGATTVYLDSIYGPSFSAPPAPPTVGEYMIEDYETVRKLSYGVAGGTFTNNVANPSVGGINTSATVGKYERNGGVYYDYCVGTLPGQALDIANYMNNTKRFSLKVYTNAPVGTGIDITAQNHVLALGGYPTGRHSVYHTTVTAQNAWQTLTFAYSSQPSTTVANNQIDEVVFAFASPSNTSYTFYIDDFKGFDICSAPATPTITSNTGSLVICNSGSVTLTSSLGSNYLWSNGATSRSIVVSSAGNYTVNTFNNSGCTSATSATAAVTVTQNLQPTIIAGGPTTFCPGGLVTLTSSASSGNVWSNGATTRSINVNTSGSYTVRSILNGTCSSAISAATTVTVNASLPTPSISVSGPTTIQQGSSVTLSAPADEAGYLWSNGSTSQSISVNAAGSYSVRIISGSGCTSSTSAAITISVVSTSTSTTWNGTSWSNGTPSSTLNAFVNAPLNTSSSMTALSLSMSANVTLGASFTVLGSVSTGLYSVSGSGNLILAGSSSQSIGGTFNNVTLNNSAGATLSNFTSINGTLSLVRGTLNAGSANYLTLKGTSTGQATIDDFTSGNIGTISGNYTYQVWSPNATNFSSFRHLAVPVANATRSAVSNVSTQYDYSEVNGTWSPISSATLSGSLSAGKSFLGAALGNTAIAFTGAHSTGSLNMPLVRTNGLSTASVQLGYNAIGNPYPCTIDWTLVKNISGNTSVSNCAAWVYKGGQYITIDRNGVSSSSLGSRYLAAGQGFLIRRSTVGGTANFVFNNTIKVSNASTTFREESLAENLRLRLSSNATSINDEIHIYSNTSASSNLDELDAEKVISPIAEAPALFVSTSSKDALSLSAMPMLSGSRTITVQATINATGTYTLSALEIGTFPVGYSILLEDKAEGITQPIDRDYTFTAKAGSTRTFYVHFTNSGSANGAEKVDVYTNDNMLNVAFSSVEAAQSQITVLNTLGQVVASIPANGQSLVSTQLTLPSGVYIVKVLGANCKTSTRILWNNK